MRLSVPAIDIAATPWYGRLFNLEVWVTAESNRTVFLVDDDEPVRDSLKTLLESYSMAVQDYPSCPDLLQEFDPKRAGCVVLDLNVPVMSGLEFIEVYRDRLAAVPVIMITGRGDAATRGRALEAGAVDFSEKPFDDEILVDTIRDGLDRMAA